MHEARPLAINAQQSATVPTGSQSEADVLDVRAVIWQQRPLLREIYNRYFAEMVANLAQSSPQARNVNPQNHFGTILEIGGGSGNFKHYFHEHCPGHGHLIASDIVPTPHCDLAADAMALPFPDNSLDNILMQDVLHHVPFPLRFFAEARRVLRPGGRIVMTEPYISPASRLIFAVGHPEPVVPSAKIFANTPQASSLKPQDFPDPSPLRGQGAFASNQATPTLLFYRDRKLFQQRFPQLKILALRRRSLFVYPLSGGFSGPKILPRFLEPLGWQVEKLLTPLAPLFACRLLAVIENQKSAS